MSGPGGDLGVVVLHWRHWPAVRPTIDSVLRQGIDPRRVCIVDNASRDGSVDHIREQYPECLVLELNANEGYAAGMNAGIRALGHGDTLLLTHECVLWPEAVQALIACLDSDSTVGAVGPLLVYSSDVDTVFSCGGELVGRRLRTEHRGADDAVADHRGDARQHVDWLDGACLLIRRRMLDAIGMFDESYFLYFEEADLLTRARKAGWTIVCEPRAVASQEPAGWPDALWVRNRLRFLARNGSRLAVIKQLEMDLIAAVKALRCRDAAQRRRAYLIMRGVFAPMTRTSPKRLFELSRPGLAN